MKSELAYSVPRLKRLLPRFRKLRIGVLGDLMLDRYVMGEASRLSPEAPVPVVNYESQEEFAGGAGNVAANIAALGAYVELFGAIGGAQESKRHAGKSTKDFSGRSWSRRCGRGLERQASVTGELLPMPIE